MPAKWFSIQAGQTAKTHKVLIHDQIGKDWWTGDGVASKEFSDEWGKIPRGDKVDVHINSPGGSVWDGYAIHNMIAARREFMEPFYGRYADAATQLEQPGSLITWTHLLRLAPGSDLAAVFA